MRTLVLALLALAPTTLAHPGAEVCPIGGSLEICAHAHEDTAAPTRSTAGAEADLWLCCSYGAAAHAERYRYPYAGNLYDGASAGAVVYGTPTGALTSLGAGASVERPFTAPDPGAWICVKVHSAGPCQTVLP